MILVFQMDLVYHKHSLQYHANIKVAVISYNRHLTDWGLLVEQELLEGRVH